MKNSSIKKVDKGWGYELWFHNDEKYCGKLLFFEKGKKCSFHYHIKKHETFYLHSGSLKCTFVDINDLSDESKHVHVVLNAGDTKEIYPGLVHQMEAIEDAELFEFSTQHFDDDSIRIIKGD